MPTARGSTLAEIVGASRDLWRIDSHCIEVALVAATAAKHSPQVMSQVHVQVTLLHVHSNTGRDIYIYTYSGVEKRGEDDCGRAPICHISRACSSLQLDSFKYDS